MYCLFFVLVISGPAIGHVEVRTSKMTCNVSGGMLNPALSIYISVSATSISYISASRLPADCRRGLHAVLTVILCYSSTSSEPTCAAGSWEHDLQPGLWGHLSKWYELDL